MNNNPCMLCALFPSEPVFHSASTLGLLEGSFKPLKVVRPKLPLIWGIVEEMKFHFETWHTLSPVPRVVTAHRVVSRCLGTLVQTCSRDFTSRVLYLSSSSPSLPRPSTLPSILSSFFPPFIKSTFFKKEIELKGL